MAESRSLFTRTFFCGHTSYNLTTFSEENYNVKFVLDNGKVAEMEFYLVDDLECDLVVFHPYRTLLALCKKESTSSNSEEGEEEEPGTGVEDGPRYWGSGEGQLEFTAPALQTAWYVSLLPSPCSPNLLSFRSIINDTYRSQLCLLYPPHLIAIAAIYLTFILHPPTRPDTSPISEREEVSPERQPRRSSRQAHHPPPVPPKKPQDPIAFLSELNVSLPLIATIAQEIISLYTLWDQYKEDVSPDSSKLVRELTNSPMPSGATPKKSSRGTDSVRAVSTPGRDEMNVDSLLDGNYVTPALLSSVLHRMREAKLLDVTATRNVTSRPIDKRIERTQAVG